MRGESVMNDLVVRGCGLCLWAGRKAPASYPKAENWSGLAQTHATHL